MKNPIKTLVIATALSSVYTISHAALPDPGMQIEKGHTVLVVTDPHNDFLSPDGVTWGVVGKNVEANNTAQNIETLLKTAKAEGMLVFVSPHYDYPHDHGWRFEGALATLMHKIGMFDRKNALSLEGFDDTEGKPG
jgi:nicotinamidase-related amidase